MLYCYKTVGKYNQRQCRSSPKC